MNEANLNIQNAYIANERRTKVLGQLISSPKKKKWIDEQIAALQRRIANSEEHMLSLIAAHYNERHPYEFVYIAEQELYLTYNWFCKEGKHRAGKNPINVCVYLADPLIKQEEHTCIFCGGKDLQ
jgi:hypothetical protein